MSSGPSGPCLFLWGYSLSPPTFAQCFMEITHASWRWFHLPHLYFMRLYILSPLSFPSPSLHLEKPYLFLTQFKCLALGGLSLPKTILPSSRVDGTFLCTTLDMPPAWPLIHHMRPYLSPPLPWEQGSVLFMVHSWYWDHAGTIVGAQWIWSEPTGAWKS